MSFGKCIHYYDEESGESSDKCLQRELNNSSFLCFVRELRVDAMKVVWTCSYGGDVPGGSNAALC